ncbi:allatostatin-A receptor-like [Patiria miniata]|uniref:G-protein coupled receptors family 1 profile domain-containing protein n=1 Tax=Patiria miniata TaxID=46514 RepID=A0A914BMZ0_PATMI|nr:allatostatin-A receptor-like [Patiria miniata]
MDSPENTTEGTEATTGDLDGEINNLPWDWFWIVQLVLALVGLLGNSLVIMVYLKKLRVRSNSNKLIALLALADLLTSVAAIPLPTLSYVPLTAAGRVYCKLIHSRVIMWISIVASVFTLTLLSVERFFAVVYPVRHKIVFSKPRLKRFVAAVWISAVILNCGSFYIPDVGEQNFCVLLWPSPAYQAFHGLTLFIVEFVIPVAVMVVSHYFAVRGLKRQAQSLLARNKSKTSPAFSLLQSRGRVIRMVLIVVVTFIICWAPDQIGFLILNFGGLSPEYFSSLTYRAFTVLAFLNSCINPAIYIGLNKNFRAAVGQLLPCIKRQVGIMPEQATGTLHQIDTAGHGASGSGQHPTPAPPPPVPYTKNAPIFTIHQHQKQTATNASSSGICVESCS